jgi:sn-glycerol 3-phosphate transport system substrate-binding protein
MANSQTGGKVWGVPFQRSTIVLYWNKELFKEAGLDPNRPPENWKEMLEYAQKLTKRDASGNVTQWGVQIPSFGVSVLAVPGPHDAERRRAHEHRRHADLFRSPEVIEALTYWVDLGRKHKVMAPGVIEWGTTPKDFFERKTAMMYTTTGNLTNVRNNAKFDFGVAMLPAAKRRGSPTGGGNFYVFKKSTKEQQQAALKFIKFVTTPERAAQWGIDTGYVAGASGRLGDREDAGVREGISGGRRRARPAAVFRRRAFDARQPARHESAERRDPGGAHRREDARAGNEGCTGRSRAHPESGALTR